MSNLYEEYYWQKLDNAAKIFPAISSQKASNVFRIAANMKEAIDSEILFKALELTLKELPAYKVKIRRGLFWYYFETNFATPQVKQEDAHPVRKMEKHSNNSYLFTVTYFRNRINLEVFHVLSDGVGAIVFIKALVYYYLKLLKKDEIVSLYTDVSDDSSNKALSEDSFLNLHGNNSENIDEEKKKNIKAYQIESVKLFANEIKVIEGILPTKELLALSKKHGVSLTSYLSSIIIYAIYTENYKFKPNNCPIVVCIPINLRNYFDSKTMRNFFSCVNVGVDFSKGEIPFDEVVRIVSDELKKGVDRNTLSAQIKSNVDKEKNLLVRFAPLFLKNLIVNIFYNKSRFDSTTTFSNLGQIRLPEDIAKHVRGFEVLLSPAKSQSVKTSLMSFENEMIFSFTLSQEETDVAKYFFRFLAAEGIDVKIISNEVTRDEKM